MANKVYDYVTQNIIEQLKQGTIPWQKPWRDGVPINYITRKPYRGINLFLLPKSGEYLTFKQVEGLGGKVKKGSKAHMIVFWKISKYEKEKKLSSGETRTEEVIVPILRYYKVFHLSDVEGIESKLETFEHNSIESAEKIVNEYNEVPILHLEDSAYYSPSRDFINLPSKEKFSKIEEYYSTAFHEIVHSTGHKSRLNRFEPEGMIFGSETYSSEELVAELGASMLCGVAGIEQMTINNSAAYIKSWLSKLQGDSTLIIRASSKAQKASDYILKAAGLSVEENIDDILDEVA